jgi:hypothetical protein
MLTTSWSSTGGSLNDHLNKLEVVFIQLRNAGLKVNVTKSVFCAQETEYLGCIVTKPRACTKVNERILTNYGTVYLSNGWEPHGVSLELVIMRVGGKLPSFLTSESV